MILGWQHRARSQIVFVLLIRLFLFHTIYLMKNGTITELLQHLCDVFFLCLSVFAILDLTRNETCSFICLSLDNGLLVGETPDILALTRLAI
jgi:hypothetical protein